MKRLAYCLLALLGFVSIGASVGSAKQPSTSVPRVGLSGTVGPVCARQSDGVLRYVRLFQRCQLGERRIYMHIRLRLAHGLPPGVRGPAGAPGPRGPQGPAGPAGAKGDVGARGPQGERGAAGARGPQGEKGAVGPRGPQGDKGDKGERGAVGLRGPQGEKGPAGPRGEQGKPGERGPRGEKGDKGDSGQSGSIGAVTTVHDDFVKGEKRLTVNCPQGQRALGGGFYNVQGGVRDSYRSNSDARAFGTTSWTVTVTTNVGTGTVFVYCAVVNGR
jgi:hypothetical protein